MTELRISKELALPIDVAGQTIGLVGIRGSGKTNTAGVIAEELLDKNHPIVVIDPTDAWWGVRSGYPIFIFGGTHGDIPLQDTDGRVIAEFVVKERVPLILSLRHLRKNAQRRLVTDFCEELYHLKGQDQYRTPLTVFIDEAPLFVPQKVLGELARTVGAVEDLIARGRSSGFGVVLISQRSATINKDVLTQADTIITHRLTGPQDRKALQEWIEENASLAEQKEVLSSLATMPNGRAWVWAPRLDVMKQVQIKLRRTFDSSASPKIGERLTPPKKLTEIDLELLKGRLAEAVKEAQENDPKALRAEIARLQRELQRAPGVQVDEKALAARYLDGVKYGHDTCKQAMDKEFTLARQLLAKAGDILADLSIAHGVVSRAYDIQPPQKSVTAQRSVPVAKPIARSERATAPAGGITRMLTALAHRPQGMNRKQLGVRAGLASKGGTFGTYLGRMRSEGWINGDASIIRITQAGLTALGSYTPLPVGAELRAHWLGVLGNSGAARLLQVLSEAYPDSLPKAVAAERANLASNAGTFGTYLGRLRALELVTGSGELRAADELFD